MMMFYALLPLFTLSFQKCDRRDRGGDRLVVRFTSITTEDVSSNPAHG